MWHILVQGEEEDSNFDLPEYILSTYALDLDNDFLLSPEALAEIYTLFL